MSNNETTVTLGQYTIIDDPHGYARMYGYIQSSSHFVPSFYKEQFETLAHKYWDKFYTRHSVNFFKDRHWIEREFPELVGTETKRVLEVGCGVGNTTFPVLERNKNLHFHSFDFSKVAVEHLKQFPLFEKYSNRCTPFVYAISPEKMKEAVTRMRQALKPGGIVLLRDYAKNDLAQQRFEVTPKASQLDENYMVRGDGTLSYYFSLEILEKLFTDNGFKALENKVVAKEVTNRKQEKQMSRLFVQGKYQKDKETL